MLSRGLSVGGGLVVFIRGLELYACMNCKKAAFFLSWVSRSTPMNY